jgi:hypothetical protein
MKLLVLIHFTNYDAPIDELKIDKMRKCVIMFVLLILVIAMAVLIDERMEVAPTNNYIADAPRNHALLTTLQDED